MSLSHIPANYCADNGLGTLFLGHMGIWFEHTEGEKARRTNPGHRARRNEPDQLHTWQYQTFGPTCSSSTPDSPHAGHTGSRRAGFAVVGAFGTLPARPHHQIPHPVAELVVGCAGR